MDDIFTAKCPNCKGQMTQGNMFCRLSCWKEAQEYEKCQKE